MVHFMILHLCRFAYYINEESSSATNESRTRFQYGYVRKRANRIRSSVTLHLIYLTFVYFSVNLSIVIKNLRSTSGFSIHVWCFGKMSGLPMVRNTRLLIEAISVSWIASSDG